jgi:tetratricopeptide (TPR) repeat protein
MASAWVLAPLFQIVPAWLSPFSRRALGVAMFVVLLTTGAVSYQRAALWRDGETLFGADVAQEPDNPFALYHLGVSIERRAGCANAVPLFQRAASLQPNTWRPWHNTAGCLLRLGRWDEASVAAATAVKLRPQHPGSLLNFGLVELHEGHLEEAKGALRACEGANGAEKRCLELASAIQAAQKLPLSAPR